MPRLEKHIHLNAPVGRLWPLISDTERMNRAGGLAPVAYRAQGNAAGPANVFAESKFGPLKMKWQEFPFEWVEEDHLHVLRRFSSGPLKEMRPGMSLSGSDGGTDIRMFLDFEPRNAIGNWVARYLMWPAVLAKFQKILRAMESYVSQKGPDPFWEEIPKARVDRGRMEILAGRVRSSVLARSGSGCEEHSDEANYNSPRCTTGSLALLGTSCAIPLSSTGLLRPPLEQWRARNDIVDLMLRYLTDATDLDVSAMRPFALADRWGKDRMEVLRMFLLATREGLLDLSWEILCPNCRKSKSSSGSLAGLSGKAHCDYCQIQFDAEFDRSVEARFRVNASVRKVQRNEFCAGGPANTPHVLAQVLVQAGEKRRITLHTLGAPLKVRAPQVAGFARVRVLDMATTAHCVLTLANGAITPAAVEVKTGEVIFELSNVAGQERWFIIERERWDEAVATAAQVTSLQEFRDMFSSEVLAPGEEIAVRNLTFLFTDLAGSTATYHDLGDAKAYAVVREHFTVLKEAIAKHEGAVVKTIGDAVMAVFYSPRNSVLAAVDMQNGIQRWNASRKNQTPVVLKIGLHEGPAIAVNTDDILDYFGTSVNLAARIEGLSSGGDIVVSDDVMRAVELDGMPEQIVSRKEKLESPVKGFPKPVRAWRIWPK